MVLSLVLCLTAFEIKLISRAIRHALYGRLPTFALSLHSRAFDSTDKRNVIHESGCIIRRSWFPHIKTTHNWFADFLSQAEMSVLSDRLTRLSRILVISRTERQAAINCNLGIVTTFKEHT